MPSASSHAKAFKGRSIASVGAATMGGPGFRAAKNEKLGRAHRQADFFGLPAVVDAAEDGQAVGSQPSLKPYQGIRHGIVAAKDRHPYPAWQPSESLPHDRNWAAPPGAGPGGRAPGR